MPMTDLNTQTETLFLNPVPIANVEAAVSLPTPEEARFDRVVKLAARC